MTRKHATMTDGEGICLAFQSEHGGFDCSEASIDRISGALICHDGTLEGLGEGVADAAIYPTAEIFAGARLLALDRVAEGYADGRDAHAIDAAAKSVAESIRRNCIELGGAGASMIDFAGHPFATSQWIGKNFRTSISEVDARRLMQDLTLVDIARLDRSRPLIEGLGMQARESILAFLDSMEELRASSVDVELFDRLMTDDFNVVRTLGRDRSRELGTVTVHGRDIEISCTLADGFCATARPQTGTILTFSSRRLGWHGFQSSPPLVRGLHGLHSTRHAEREARPRLRPRGTLRRGGDRHARARRPRPGGTQVRQGGVREGFRALRRDRGEDRRGRRCLRAGARKGHEPRGHGGSRQGGSACR